MLQAKVGNRRRWSILVHSELEKRDTGQDKKRLRQTEERQRQNGTGQSFLRYNYCCTAAAEETDVEPLVPLGKRRLEVDISSSKLINSLFLLS